MSVPRPDGAPALSPPGGGGEPPPVDLLDTPEAGPAAIRGGVLRVVAFVGGLVASVAAFAIVARHLGVVDTGRYALVLAIVTFVGGLSDLGLTAIGVRELSVLTGEARERLARNLLGLRLVLGVVGGAAMIGFAAVAGYGETVVGGVALGAVGLLLQGWQSTLAIGLMSDLRLRWVAAFDFLRAVATAVLVGALALAGAGLLPFIAVMIPVGIVVLAWNALVVRGRMPLLPAFAAGQWRRLFATVLPYSVAVAAASLYFQLAVIIVSLVAGAKDVGYFGVSSRTVQILLILPTLSVGAAFPIFARAARDDRERLAYALGRVFEVSLIFAVLVSLLLGVGASIAIAVLGGSRFAPAADVLAIQGIGLGASFCGAVWSYGLLSLGRYGAILKMNMIALALGGVLVAVLAAVEGARGAAVGTATCEVTLALLNGWALVRADRRLKPPLRVLAPVALAAGLALLSTIPDLPVLASTALAGAIYCAAILTMRTLPDELRVHLLGRVR